MARTSKALILSAGLLLTLAHTFQSMVVSGGSRTPGDLADARFTHLVLEHVYQSALGHQRLDSPAQFHPVEKTLYYGDAHWGTVLIYIAARLAGVSMSSSIQVWLVTIQVLNVLAFFYLLSVAGVRWGLRPFVTFFALAGFHMTWKIGASHLHPLLLFPFILSAAFLLRFLRHRRVPDLCASAAFLTFQHYAYVYLGYLGFFVWAAVVLAAWAFPPDAAFRKEVRSILPTRWRALALTGAACLAALAILYWPYLKYMSTTEIRSMASVRSLSPHVHFWLSAPPDSLLYSWHSLLGEHAHRSESRLFQGWFIWLLSGLALVLYRSRRESPVLRLAVMLLLSWAGLALFFTALGSESSGWSPYLLLAKVLPPLRAFRAVGRVSFLMAVLLGLAAGLVLQELSQSPFRRWRVLSWLFAGLLVLDVAAVRQRSYSKEVAERRAGRLAETVLRREARPVFAYMPRDAGKRWYFAQLDAWHAAMLTGRRTVNGYSGNFPDTYEEFGRHPTMENLRRLADRSGLSMDDILLIEEDFPKEE